MKILATMLTWNNLEFFKCALTQALDHCDEVIVIEGCHSKKFPQRSTDGTVEYLASIKHPKLKILDIDYKKEGMEGQRYDRVQCKLWNIANESFKLWEPGNWLVRWDDDLFWLDEDFKKVKKILETIEQDRVNFSARYFIYNFRINFLKFTGIRFDRITPGCYYTPIAKLHYKDGKEYKYSIPFPKIVSFHYSCMKKPERMKARWRLSVERGTRRSLVAIAATRFKRWMDIEWNNDNDIIRQEDLLREFVSRRDEKVEFYDGKHPEVLDNHPWRYIKDVRTIT